MGPLPQMLSGNAYILVFIDYFLKWIKVCAVREVTALVAARKLLSEVLSRHGAPKYFISDRGSEVQVPVGCIYELCCQNLRPYTQVLTGSLKSCLM